MKMNVLAVIAATGLVSAASAEVLLSIDLTVTDQITITSTGGLSSADASGSNFTGYLLANFFNDSSFGSGTGAGVGDLTTLSNPSDGSPSLFSSTSSFGLNVWSFSTDSTVSVTSGAQAFTGSGTWTIGSAEYAAMVAGNISGDIYFGADTDDDIGGAGVELIGTYRVIPAPSSLALIGLGGLVAGRRRR